MARVMLPCCGLLLLGSLASAADWPGWRGLEAQGVSDVPGPVTWSAAENVRWRIDLPGEGHSSPIVADDKVFVTAAYPRTQEAPTRKFLLLLVPLGLGLLGIWYVSRMSLGPSLFVSLLMGVLVYSAYEILRYGLPTDHRSQYFTWIHSYAALGLAVMMAGVGLPPRSVRRFLSIGVLASLAVLVVVLRPNPEYYGFNIFTRDSSAVLAVIGAILGGAALALSVLAVRSRSIGSTAVRQGGAIGVVLFVVGIFGFGLPFLYMQLSGHGWISEGSLLGPCGLYAVRTWPYLIAFGAWLAALVRPVPPRPGISAAVLALAGLAFIGANAIRPHSDYTRAVVCLNRTDGKTLWSREVCSGPKCRANALNSQASPTPVVNGGRVYAWFGTPGLACVDRNGNLLWKATDLPFECIHGVGASPVVVDDKLIVLSGNSRAPYIAAFNAEGDRLWTTKLKPWPGLHGEHRTPAIVRTADRAAVLNWTMYYNDLAAYDVRDGRELWRVPVELRREGEAVAGILQSGSTLYLAGKAGVLAMDVQTRATLWKTDLKGRGPNTASPVSSNSLLFMVSDNGYASCLDPQTGAVCWQERLPGGQYYASPTVAGGCVYFPSVRGVTTVVACEREFRKLAENTLPGGICASPAPVDRQLFIRTTRGLWCISHGEKTP